MRDAGLRSRQTAKLVPCDSALFPQVVGVVLFLVIFFPRLFVWKHFISDGCRPPASPETGIVEMALNGSDSLLC